MSVPVKRPADQVAPLDPEHCPNCADMAKAQKQLARQRDSCQRKLDILLKAFDTAYTDEDTLDWGEK